MASSGVGDGTEDPIASFPATFLRKLDGCGVLRADGKDFLDLLHRLSTNDVKFLTQGDVAETIIVTEKARILDCVLVLCLQDHTLLLTSPGRTRVLLEWLDKYTIMEDARYSDLTAEFAQYEINGDLEGGRIGPGPTPKPSPWRWEFAETGDAPVLFARHESICGPGIRCLVPKKELSGFLLNAQTQLPAPMNESQFEPWRIARGLPKAAAELTDQFHPLECGASKAVSFTKGCYIGQEVIARLDSYNKVQRHLRKLSLRSVPASPPNLPCELSKEGKSAGLLTSWARLPGDGPVVGLGCIRVACESPGTILSMSTADGSIEVTVSG
jgi:tRNA-modifying protein YgfZ